MMAAIRKLTWMSAATLLLSGVVMAQTGAIEGDVKGEDGQPLRGALVKIERTDIKGNYKVKTDKKGHYFHAGLPLGMYNVVLEVDGKDRDQARGVRTRLGDPIPVHFDLQAIARKQQSLQKAAETGTLTQEQSREMTKEQREQMEKTLKERAAQMAKNKELNEAFNVGMEAMKTKNWQGAVDAFTKASTLDPKQHVIWAQLADSYVQLGAAKTGDEQNAAYAKGMEYYVKALELKPDDAAYHNNYGLALARARKIPEAQAEFEKAATLDPPAAGRYYYNLGAVLVNTGQIDPSGEAFKKAIAADPTYADAHYQYGIFLLSKASTTADGKVVPPPGTKEAFAKYLELRPDGANAQNAKDMITSLEGTVQTEFTNPDAKKAQQQKKAKKK